jgi:acetylglutamate kinase
MSFLGYFGPMITILKIGGNIINDPIRLEAALDYFASLSYPGILVHGGGRKASEVLSEMGIQPKMIQGRRLTDAATLEVVTMVYAGLINKNIVAELQRRSNNAIGLSGADGNVIKANKRPVNTIDYGFAGDVEVVNGKLLVQLLAAGLSPILCPITHDGQGQLLNTNADTIANEAAKAVAATGKNVRLCYCFELPGVLEDIKRPESIIRQITPAKYARLKAAGIVADGMIPKLDNAFAALEAGVEEVLIGNLDSLRSGKATVLLPV